MKLATKIIRRQCQHGYLYSFSIVRNMRINGTPTNIRIAGLGSVRQSDIKNDKVRLEFWGKANKAINKLLTEKRLTPDNAEKIKDNFAKIVPPVAKKVDLGRYKQYLVETA